VAGAINVNKLSCRVLLSTLVADKTDVQAKVVGLVLILETECGATFVKLEFLGLDRVGALG